MSARGGAALGAGFNAPVRGTPVIRPQTAATMRHILEMSAGNKDAVSRAAVPGYRIGGKTGTTKKLEGGRYVKKYVSSFIGMAPMSNPRVIVAVMIDEPGAGKYPASTRHKRTRRPPFAPET